jgi:hypothetical protein
LNANAAVKTESDTSKGVSLRPGNTNPMEDPTASTSLGVGNGIGAIGSPSYPEASASPVNSTNGQEDRTQQPVGNQQPPRFAATLSDLMTSFKTAGLKGKHHFSME